jgi:hypothetical protein
LKEEADKTGEKSNSETPSDASAETAAREASENPSALNQEKPAGCPETSPPAKPAKERNLLANIMATWKHIDRCENDKTVTFRHSDTVSLIGLFAAFGMEVVLVILYQTSVSLRPFCIVLAIVADICFGFAILWYVLLRFGALRSFDSRQTLLAWQLMIGSGALFAFYTMNLAFLFFIYYNSPIILPLPPGL